MNEQPNPGLIVLFGSGETSPSGRKAFDVVMSRLPVSPRLALVETPAGFELNSAQVIGRVASFLNHRLQNYQPRVTTIPARKRGTPFSPDEANVVEPLLHADLIFMGPGSPTYAVRQLRDSLAWQYTIARHLLGASLALASAATIAMSYCALPVYEIFKVGEDLHWKEGLDFFGLYGLKLVFIPHWNNVEGGAELDTSRCFMGQTRFARLTAMLPENITIVGLDENTALVMDTGDGTAQVIGAGEVTLLHTGHSHIPMQEDSSLEGSGLKEIAVKRGGHVHTYHDGESFPLNIIGPFRPYHPEVNLPPEVWQRALQVAQAAIEQPASALPPDILALVEARQKARDSRNWSVADSLREQIQQLGWQVKDTPDGMVVEKI